MPAYGCSGIAKASRALGAAQQPAAISGVVLVSAPGKPQAEVMRTLEGRHIDPATLPPPLPNIFPAAVQGLMVDLFAQKPAALAASLTMPVLVVQGDRDMQGGIDDARALASAAPHATLVVVPGVHHVLEAVASDHRAADLATCRDSTCRS